MRSTLMGCSPGIGKHVVGVFCGSVDVDTSVLDVRAQLSTEDNR
jgi:hypothetical protein